MSQDIVRIIGDAFTFIRSEEANQSISALTLDHVIQQQIDALQQGTTRSIVDPQGNSVGQRVSLYDRLSQLETDIDNVVSAVNNAGSDPNKLTDLGFSSTDSQTSDQ